MRPGSKEEHLGGEVAEGDTLVDLVHIDMANTLIHVHQQPHSVVVSKGRPSRPPVCLAVHVWCVWRVWRVWRVARAKTVELYKCASRLKSLLLPPVRERPP